MKKPLKILIWFWGRRGGGPRYTLGVARALANRRDISIYLSLSNQSEIYNSFNDIPAVGRFDIDTYRGVGQFGIKSLSLPILRWKFRRYIREQKIDVVFCTMDHIWNTFMTGVFRESDTVYLLTVHDAIRHLGENPRWRQWLLRRDIVASDSVMVLTRSVSESLKKKYRYPADRIFLSAHGHFGDGNGEVEARKMPTDRPLRLLFFGRILEYKGLDLMLAALQLLRRDFPTLKLEVFGSGNIAPYRAALDTVGDVHVVNRWIEEVEISSIFSTTDLCVLPYREASQSGVVATAFAFGMPCIATPIPGLCEQVSDGVTGSISRGFSPADYAEAIAKVLRDPASYAQLSLNCINAAKTALSWEKIGPSVVDALRGAHAKGKREMVH